MDEDRFRYVEQDPPLTGEERKRDYHRQYQRWRYHAIPEHRERVKATQIWHYHNNPVYRATNRLKNKLAHMERVASGEAAEYQRKRAADKRARMLAGAREYGATLAVAVGLMLPGVASAQEPNIPKCPSLRDVSTVLREQFKEAPIATWLDKPTGDVVTLFAGESGESTTLVISRGECAAVIAEGAMLRTWAIVGGEEA